MRSLSLWWKTIFYPRHAVLYIKDNPERTKTALAVFGISAVLMICSWSAYVLLEEISYVFLLYPFLELLVFFAFIILINLITRLTINSDLSKLFFISLLGIGPLSLLYVLGIFNNYFSGTNPFAGFIIQFLLGLASLCYLFYFVYKAHIIGIKAVKWRCIIMYFISVSLSFILTIGLINMLSKSLPVLM